MPTLRTRNGARWVEPLAETRRARSTRAGLVALGVAVAYYVGARIGFALTPTPLPVSTLWPPNAILLAALLLAPLTVLLTRLPALAGNIDTGNHAL